MEGSVLRPDSPKSSSPRTLSHQELRFIRKHSWDSNVNLHHTPDNTVHGMPLPTLPLPARPQEPESPHTSWGTWQSWHSPQAAEMFSPSSTDGLVD